MRIIILFLTFSLALWSCCKEPAPDDKPEIIDFSNLTGKIAFSRSSGVIMILDGNDKTIKQYQTKIKENIWQASVSLSPDGKYIAYSADAPDGYQVYKMSLTDGSYTKLTRSGSGFVEHYTFPIWSSDGGKIFYVANGSIIPGPVFSIRPDGTELKQITPFDVYRRISVSEDNSFIAYASVTDWVNNSQGIYLYYLTDGANKTVKTINTDFTAYSPVLSPDGKDIAFVLRHGPNEQGTPPFFFRIMICNVDGSGERSIVELPFTSYVDDLFVTWSPDGEKLAFNFGSGTASDHGSHIFIINSDGTGLTQVTNNTDYDGSPSWIK